MQKINDLILELENNINNFTQVNNAISYASIGWHIEHCLVIFSRVISALENSNPQEYKSQFNFKRSLLFITNTIPRGKVKAPSVALPEGEITETSLKEHLEKVKLKLSRISALPKNSFFAHPFLNDLNVKQTQKYFVLHTTHHVKIIRDIVNK